MFDHAFQTVRSAMAMPYVPVDVPGQAKSYRLVQRGTEDGSANQPETGSEFPALAEQQIITAIHSERERCLGDLTAHLRAERDALAHLQTAMDIAGMRQAAGVAMANLSALDMSYDSVLASTRQRAASFSAEFEEFRRRNRLARVARQPNSRVYAGVLMAFLIVVEGVTNAGFFAGGSDSGLVGGAALAATFSLVNVSVGMLNGWFPLRWAHHRNLAIRLIGLTAFPIVCVGSLALNAFVAHYRDVAQTTPEADPLKAAFSGLAQNPFGLQSIVSWLLFVLGIACAGLAMAKGFALDDPHPGYGAYDRRRIAAQSAYEKLREELIEGASEIRDEFASQLHEKIESLRGSSSQRQQLLGARARNLGEFEANEANLAYAAQQLLTIYRMANKEARMTPPPARFGTVFHFSDRALERPALRSLLQDQGLEVNAERLIQELDDLRRQVFERYEASLRETASESPT